MHPGFATNPAAASAFAQGDVSLAHVDALRTITQANAARRGGYPAFETALLQVAANADPTILRRTLRAWASHIDPDTDDKDAADTSATALPAIPGGRDEWAISGRLPGVLGAELSGILNAAMEANRREPTDTPGIPAPARRADALLDLARSAANASCAQGSETTSSDQRKQRPGRRGSAARRRSP